jgi:hypothetical protein
MISTITHTFISYIHRTDIFIVDKNYENIGLILYTMSEIFQNIEVNNLRKSVGFGLMPTGVIK